MHTLTWSDATALARSGSFKWAAVVICVVGAAGLTYFTPGSVTAFTEASAPASEPAATLLADVDNVERQKKAAGAANLPEQ